MRRRDLLAGTAALSLLAAGGLGISPAAAQGAPDSPFSAYTVRQIARDLAQQKFKPLDMALPEPLRDLSYDRYRAIRFLPERSIWRGDGQPFEMQLFHRGFLFANRVDISIVADGRARPVAYSPDLFFLGDIQLPASTRDLGFSGFRLHAPLNRPDYLDEVAVFLGASYFRAVGKGQGYGLSARGLSIKTADPSGEEFPAFRAFWVERPQPGTNSVVVHALLDSESAAAAYRFTIRPGDNTVFDVEATIYPRIDVAQPGLATLTSMFYFNQASRRGIDDFRGAVHDSDGLAIWNGRGEQLWRPLRNPRDLQVSAFADVNPRGFGLMQRERDFRAYQDLEAHYERRPSLWVEPIGDWGEGALHLVEIPTSGEIHDNIALFWRPREPLRAKAEYTYVYRLHWGQMPWQSELARIARTRVGAAAQPDRRLFVVEAEGGKLRDLPADAPVRIALSANAGKISNEVTQANPVTGGWRASFQLAPEKAAAIELRAQFMRGDEPVSEVWIYRWTP